MIVSFSLGVHEEFELAADRIRKLRAFYGPVEIISILDGTRNDDYEALCAREGVTCIPGERLKVSGKGGAWTKRRLEAFMAGRAEVCVKIDPDTDVVRAAREWPTADVFRPLTLPKAGFNGSCLGLSRAVVEKLLNSAVLDDPWYATPLFSLPGGLASEDGILRHALPRAGIFGSKVFAEAVHLQTPMDVLGYAFVHPMRNLRPAA